MTEIRDNKDRSQYEVTLDGSTAYVAYDREGADRIVFTHTVVPEALSGRGLAGEIVKYALDDARAQGLRVVPQCTYVQSYLKRHPEYEDLVTTTP
ncbi:MAG TPA: GNAT family N-acetyltransferase [Thermoanaerobaculia bacterium]|nr:GNAT family N-acetyltransferase [Thermoanaerobaculia bacterium]